MHATDIRRVTRADLPVLHMALQRLSQALGDTHVAGLDELETAGFGLAPAYRALLALRSGDPVGALVWSPLFSTTRGGAGLYVSDLWVADGVRGSGLGRRLLARALTETGNARFIKLAVYDDNPDAQGFYRRLGFAEQPKETNMILHGQALDTLKGPT